MIQQTKRSRTNRIIVPGGQKHDMTYILPNSNNEKVHVVEVPLSRFCGLAICLSSTDYEDIDKMHVFKHKFQKLWKELGEKGLNV